jgi:hypothetical protein
VRSGEGVPLQERLQLCLFGSGDVRLMVIDDDEDLVLAGPPRAYPSAGVSTKRRITAPASVRRIANIGWVVHEAGDGAHVRWHPVERLFRAPDRAVDAPLVEQRDGANERATLPKGPIVRLNCLTYTRPIVFEPGTVRSPDVPRRRGRHCLPLFQLRQARLLRRLLSAPVVVLRGKRHDARHEPLVAPLRVNQFPVQD